MLELVEPRSQHLRPLKPCPGLADPRTGLSPCTTLIPLCSLQLVGRVCVQDLTGALQLCKWV